MQIISGADMPPQAWVGCRELQIGGAPDCDLSLHKIDQKPHSGFFTCDLSGDGKDSSWLEFLRRSKAEREPAKETKLHRIVASPKAKIIVLDSDDDYLEFVSSLDELCMELESGQKRTWRQVEQKPCICDAVMVTESGIISTKSVLKWDIKSTLWFRFSFSEVEVVGAVTKDWKVDID